MLNYYDVVMAIHDQREKQTYYRGTFYTRA